MASLDVLTAAAQIRAATLRTGHYQHGESALALAHVLISDQQFAAASA